jgi:pimeloyl-ACP methyl ester carboxylesterase
MTEDEMIVLAASDSHERFPTARRPGSLALRALRRLRRFGPMRAVFLVLTLALISYAAYERAWIGTEARAVAVLSVTAKIPVLAWTVRVFTNTPKVTTNRPVAGVPTSVYRPGGGSEWPAIVFVNGVTARGRFHPDVERLAQGLARVGFLVFVPDPPGLREGEITRKTLAGTIAVVKTVVARPDVRGGRVALVGVSNGATLALLAAEVPSLASRIRVIAGIAPYTDLTGMIRLATTGSFLENGRLARYSAKPFLGLVIARSLFAALPPSRDRDEILARLLRFGENAPHPLAYFRELHPAELTPSVRPLVRLLANRDPRRFDRLYAALSPSMRSGIKSLSPIHEADRLRAPVYIASAPHDKYFPLYETRELARIATHTQVSLTVTSTLHHAIPSLSFSAIGDLLRFNCWMVRSLLAARRG